MPGSIHCGDQVTHHPGMLIFDGSSLDGNVIVSVADGFGDMRTELGRGRPLPVGKTHQGLSISRIGNVVVWMEVEDDYTLDRFDEGWTVRNPDRLTWHARLLP